MNMYNLKPRWLQIGTLKLEPKNGIGLTIRPYSSLLIHEMCLNGNVTEKTALVFWWTQVSKE